MTSVIELLERIGKCDRQATEALLPLVYDELRRLAAAKLRNEGVGHSLQATALVHEAYLRLTGADQKTLSWDSIHHFLGAAAEAMRRVLVDHARRRNRQKRGGDWSKHDIRELDSLFVDNSVSEDLIALDEALSKLHSIEPTAAELVKLLYFAGLTIAQAADSLGISKRTADRVWAYARSWLYAEIQRSLGNNSEKNWRSFVANGA